MQQHQEVADLLRYFVGDDRNRGHQAELDVGEEGGRDQNSIDEVVEGIADHDHHAGAAMIVLRCLRLVCLALLFVAVPPQHQFLEHEKEQNAREYGGGRLLDTAGNGECVRQDV